VIVADMQQAAGRGILRDPGELQQHLLHGLVGAPRQVLDGVVADRAGRRADRRKDIAARLIKDAALGGQLLGWRDRFRRRRGRSYDAPGNGSRLGPLFLFACCLLWCLDHDVGKRRRAVSHRSRRLRQRGTAEASEQE
jgi:hypothetical protein